MHALKEKEEKERPPKVMVTKICIVIRSFLIRLFISIVVLLITRLLWNWAWLG
uniref:hypothetical protein n=1 Tax=Cuminum cyminum TaxID=52462 RepID=UPI0023F1B9FF|nr:hypothetical protein P4C39_mgp24 [Cuminum cyminum]WDV16699.1 hypothetical protein [Cuminum cyminum]